ncbi:hypothetical protein TRKP067_2567 [Klebsiella pneumoniae]|nr:hypothetical protein P244_2731 [Klebsiella pneumoniae HK787]BBE55979.1 hypothetical protein TRKP33_2558 [Klebsiella pneumoniae]BBE61661.1 hypothetical protein TRKP064_2567 [Klebsiella pneumoniae]BBE67252.1 hypothetical protein TRKP067_2567 [Klebsiella pneumoniae]DAZ83499.1 MAG TPA: hypothetical protein [Caudoviricetes sp.]
MPHPGERRLCIDQRRRKAFTHFVIGKVSQQATFSSTS